MKNYGWFSNIYFIMIDIASSVGIIARYWWVLALILILFFWWLKKKKKLEDLPIINTREVVQLNNTEMIGEMLKAFGQRTRKNLYYEGKYIGSASREAIVKWRPNDKAEPGTYLLLEVKRALLGKTRYFLLDKEAIEEMGDIVIIRAPLDEFGGIYYTKTRTKTGTATKDLIIDWSYKRILEGELGAMEELAKHVSTYHDSYMAAKVLEAELLSEAFKEKQREKRASKAFGL